jgi:putative endonuclease
VAAVKSIRQRIGRWGEDQAAAYLSARGFEIIERNIRTPYGEIDLLAALGNSLVFVEVKTRTSMQYGTPETSITPRKQEHMLAAAQAYLQLHPDFVGDWRVDVVAVFGSPAGSAPEIVHFENALP